MDRWQNYKLNCLTPDPDHTATLPWYQQMMAVIMTQVRLPTSADLRAFLPPVYDQGPEGSCVGNGVGRGCHGLLYTLNIMSLTPSRAYIYFNAREKEGHADEDSGCSVYDGVHQTYLKGFCPENDLGDGSPFFPYIVGGYATRPPDDCYAYAKRFHLTPPLHIVNNPYYLKHCLGIFRFPIVTGFQVPAAFMDDGGPMQTTGRMPLENWLRGDFVGGHCIDVVGFIDELGEYIATNSWGPDWGKNGHFFIPKQAIEVGPDCIFDDFRVFTGLTILPQPKEDV